MTPVENAISFLFGEPLAPDIDVEEAFYAMDDDEIDDFIDVCEKNLFLAKAYKAKRRLQVKH